MFKMRLIPVLLTGLIFLSAQSASAIMLRRDIVERVPVERLAKNMEEKIRESPNNAQAVLNLARLHAMAYSLRAEEVPVNMINPNVVWFGDAPPLVPFRAVTGTEDSERLKAANVHLESAINLYDKALELKPDDQLAQLGRAWLLTQTDRKADAVAALRKVVEISWEALKDATIGVMDERAGYLIKADADAALRQPSVAGTIGGRSIMDEGAGYLIPLLDAEKDRDEIDILKERAGKLSKLPVRIQFLRPVSPIAVPLRDGLKAVDIEDRNASVTFDADGAGLKKWTWINNDAAWLVYDPKQTGIIESGLQLFGNVTFWLFWETGYDALCALDDNGDGRLTENELTGLALWHDANGNGISDPGEVKPLSEYGIAALSCGFKRDPKHPDNIAVSKHGVTFVDGGTRPTFDLILHPAE